MKRSLLALSAFAVLTTGLHADDEAGFKPIFDGKTLSGWRGDEGFWRVENGAIVGESSAEKPLSHNTFLVWDQGEVDDFELRLQFRISGTDAANSGIQFRGIQRDDGHVIGYQADIDRKGQWVGALYDEAQRGVIATRGQKSRMSQSGERRAEQVADPGELFEKINLDGWNEYSIAARGNHITLKINGETTAEVVDEDPNGLDLHGLLALQLHAGPPMKVEFRNIRLKRFPLSDGRKKVVFVAGTPSHGYMSHEHNAGCLLLAGKLNAAAKEQGLPVIATVYTNGWPKDPTAFDNADTVVSYCDGGGRHYLNAHLADFDALVNDRGVGLCCIHYAVETTPGECGEHFLKWIGGYFEPHWSVNPHWTASYEELPQHPITRGVKPFEINDEWYYHMRFVPEMKGVTPILTDLPPRETLNRPDGAHSGNPAVREAVLVNKEPQHTAWAYERPGGKGRGFGFTGGHFHKNWQHDDFRKLVLNAIVWTAGGEVPSGGVNSATPTQEEIEANQDEPKPGTEAAAQRRRPRRREQGNGAGVKPVFSSPVVTANTKGHAVDIDVDITGAKSLYLAVTDGQDGYSCDWADWAEPRLVAGKKETRLTDLKWESASSSWGDVRVGRNAGGEELRIDGQRVSYGIGTHANSVIEFQLPANHEFTRFKARGGLDNGGTDQGGGSTVQFHVFTERPNAGFLASVSGASVTTPETHESAQAVEQLEVHPGLEATLFASEPMMTNPASIDVDHLGRVWVCEAINYRGFRNADVIGDAGKQGDRILILEDTDHDAEADKATVFYQGHDVDSAHGVMVMPTPGGKGTKAIISALDSVFFLIDDDGDLKADRKEVLFTGISGAQHDHGIHAFHFGPDGKLYFNFGNEGKQIKDKSGQTIVDEMGNVVDNSRNPYQEGMVFRCNLDGSEFETLAWNFRNNWELCVDSYGTIWQSDNDDDGNQGVRINYVMEYGNYGYKDELTGAGWKEPRTGWAEEIPERHWHLNDPGVVPNLLQTGAGAPTGICVYEGTLLPEPFQGAVIHCDAGVNVCRAYVTEPDGAGYSAEIVNILDGSRNKWFRPSDVCVAPDGSILVADWYDPGVGGHRMQDIGRGRIFRIVPKGQGLKARYQADRVDVSTPEGAVAALQSPNMARRYMGWTALSHLKEAAEPVLNQLWASENPAYRARALWLLAKNGLIKSDRDERLRQALADRSPEIRAQSIRVYRQLFGNALSVKYGGGVLHRESLIALHEVPRTRENDQTVARAWTAHALQYDGTDRWYLEALGIGARGRWDECLAAWMKETGTAWKTSVPGRNIVWRSRAEITPRLLGEIIADPHTPRHELPRYFRSLDFQSGPAKNEVITTLAFLEGNEFDAERLGFIRAEALNRLQGFDLSQKPEYRAALEKVLEANRGSVQFIQLVDKFHLENEYPQLLSMAQAQPQSQVAINALAVLYGNRQFELIRSALWSDDHELVEKTLTALATAADGRSTGLLLDLALDQNRPLAARRLAVKALGASLPGARKLLEMAEKNEYPPQLKDALAATLNTAQWRVIREPAAKIFPPPPSKNSTPLPPISELIERRGDAAKGRIVFNTTGTCNKCHQVNGIGVEIGPNLSDIGKKLARPALFESILYPSAAISHNYEMWVVLTLDGQIFSGLLVSETDTELKLKDEKGIVRSIPLVAVEQRKKSDVSLMPADIQKLVTADELVDLVEYLTTLKQREQ